MILWSANNSVMRVTAVLCVSALGITNQARAAEQVTPPLNRESKARIGDELLHQGKLERREVIHLSEAIEFGNGGAYALTPGYYVRTGESIGWETYAPIDGPDSGSVKKAAGAVTLQGSFLYSNDGNTVAVVTNFYQAINASVKGITRTTRPILSRDAIQRSLVYGGATGTKIRLAYREVWKNITRPSRDVFVEYDLAESNIVNVKGARIEVIEASEEGIRYRVIQSFSSKEK